MKKVVTTPPVEIAIRTLDPDGARHVYAWFDHLKNWDNDAEVREISHRLPDLSGIYVLRTSTDIRIFFGSMAMSSPCLMSPRNQQF